MFGWTGANAISCLDLGNKFDTSNVTNMSHMFAIMTSVEEIKLGDKFDTSNVTSMGCMFEGCQSLRYLNLGEKFDTSNVTDMHQMFYSTGRTAMTSLDLGDKFDTSNVTDMSYMFENTGYTAMTNLDLGDKFDTSNVTNMRYMFDSTGYTAMTSLDLGPAFTQIADENTDMFADTGKADALEVQAPEAIFQDSTHFKLSTDSTTTIELTRGTINPKYRTEWIKEGTTIDTTDANTPKIKIKLRGTTNTAVSANEYTSDVTSALSAGNIKVLIEGTDITDIVTKEVGTATQTTNAKTGAKDILQEVTLSNFAEISRRTGKSYKEWSGNITIEVAQKSLSDKYGNKNVETTEDGARADNTIADTTQVDQNTANSMFADFIKPEFTYIYSDENIDKETQTLTVECSITDKYFNNTSWKTLSDGSYDPTGITVKLLDTNTNIPNLTKKLVKYTNEINLHVVNFTKIQETIYKTANPNYCITIMRRMMYRIMELLAKKNKALAIINGESIGQVASQTLTSMSVINSVTSMPVIRPVACLDKLEIIEIAKKIDTYDISILPYEDCCTVFVPKHPVINPNLEECLKMEKLVDYTSLIEEAVNSVETIKIEDNEEEFKDLL